MPGDGLLFKMTCNGLLEQILSSSDTRKLLQSEVSLAEEFKVSRTTIRRVMGHLEDVGILGIKRGARVVARQPRKRDYFPVDGDEKMQTEKAEQFILWKLAEKELLPGDRFPELSLARESGCNRAAIREALIKVSQYGLIEKTPRQQWRVVGLDKKLVDELMQMRLMIEEFALGQVLMLPDENPIWASLQEQLTDHERYRRESDPEAKFYEEIDAAFHQTCLAACENRFVENFFSVCRFLIEYQLRPRKLRSKRIDQAVEQHMAIIDALLARDKKRAHEAMKRHMSSVHTLMLESIDLDR